MKIIKRSVIILGTAVISVATAVLLLLIFVNVYAKINVNSEADEALFAAAKLGNITKFYANGAPLGTDDYIPIEIQTYSHAQNQKIWYRSDDVSEYLKRGFIAVEDREFFEHDGVNWRRTLLALLNSVFKFKDRFGASTITQQVVKNISGDNEITFKRKLNEIIRAVKIEKRHSKEEILELYMNIAPMGENSVGVGRASQIYFGKEPDELELHEAAMLVGITNAPTKYNPYTNMAECKKRRDFVLSSMLECGFINQDEYGSAISEPIRLSGREDRKNLVNSWFIETVSEDIIADLVSKYSISADTARLYLNGGGLSVYTTERLSVQNILDDFFSDTSNLPAEIKNGLNYGIVVADSKNGNLLGVIGQGGKKSGDRLFNYAAANHAPASTIKPLSIYAPLIDKGIINWATLIDDSPLKMIEKNGELIGYPKNSPDKYDGIINVEDAIRLSKNTVAMRLYEMSDANEIYDKLYADFGFDSLVRDGGHSDLAAAPLALGQLTKGVTLRKLTAAYTAFPSDGVAYKQRSYVSVLDNKNNVILENIPESKRVFKESTARIMNQLLMGVTENGTAKSITLKNAYDTAGKTGTSANNRDKLFVGYTPYFTIGLWCGYGDGVTPVYSIFPSHLEIWDIIATRIHNSELENVRETDLERFSTEGLEMLAFFKDTGELVPDGFDFDINSAAVGYGYFDAINRPNKSKKSEEENIVDI